LEITLRILRKRQAERELKYGNLRRFRSRTREKMILTQMQTKIQMRRRKTLLMRKLKIKRKIGSLMMKNKNPKKNLR
jgi:hypothetical protein